MAYLLFVGRTRRMTQDTASGMHHASACIETFLYIIYTHGRAWAKVLDFTGVTGFLLLNRIILYTILFLQEKVSRIDRFVALFVGHNGNKCVTFI